MVARKFRKGEVDWQALTHATSCSIVRPKGKTIEDKGSRRMVDKALAQMFTIVIVASTFMVDKAIVNHKAKPFAIKKQPDKLAV